MNSGVVRSITVRCIGNRHFRFLSACASLSDAGDDNHSGCPIPFYTYYIAVRVVLICEHVIIGWRDESHIQKAHSTMKENSYTAHKCWARPELPSSDWRARQRRLSRQPVRYALLAFLFAVLAQRMRAQDLASISGVVSDSSGAAVVGADVVVKSDDTGIGRNGVSDGSGRFRVFSLPVGEYEVRAHKRGFADEVRAGVHSGQARTQRSMSPCRSAE